MSAAAPAPGSIPAPVNPHVGPVLSDLYQLSMTYAYWKAGRHDLPSVFELFFRACPFGGDYAVSAGLSECLAMVQAFRFTPENIAYLRQSMGIRDDAFFEWLAQLDCSQVVIHAIPEGQFVYPREPLLRIEGPLAVCQLLETPLLNLINYASLMATNASRFRALVGPKKVLLEFGLRRAQGPDGGISASRYSYLGGFDGTSNVLAGQLFGIPVRGTHAHAFVQSYAGFQDIADPYLAFNEAQEHKDADKDNNNDDHNPKQARKVNFVKLVQAWRAFLGPQYLATNTAELAAFTAYALAFPRGTLALVDTYDTLGSGVRNFCVVALALHSLGYRAHGIRLDSGDLAELSKQVRAAWKGLARELKQRGPVVSFGGDKASGDVASGNGNDGSEDEIRITESVNPANPASHGAMIGSAENNNNVNNNPNVQDNEDNKDNSAMGEWAWLARCVVAASDDINEARLTKFGISGHEIDCFGVGTHLVTCQKQPALGCVYKLVQLAGVNRIKLSENYLKTTLPGRKQLFRVYAAGDRPLLDYFRMEAPLRSLDQAQAEAKAWAAKFAANAGFQGVPECDPSAVAADDNVNDSNNDSGATGDNVIRDDSVSDNPSVSDNDNSEDDPDNQLPRAGHPVVACDPFNERARVQVPAPVRVEPLLVLVWAGNRLALPGGVLPSIHESRALVLRQLRATGRLIDGPFDVQQVLAVRKEAAVRVYGSPAVARELHQTFVRNATIPLLQ